MSAFMKAGKTSGAANPLVFLSLLFLVSSRGNALTVMPPTLHVPYAAAIPLINGDPDDPAWKGAAITPPMTVSYGPAAQGLTAFSTQASLLWDAKYLYIRFVCRGGSMTSPYTHHDDPLWKADTVEVFIDPKGDGHEWVELEVSPRNVVFDQLAVLTAEPQYNDNGVLTDVILSRDWWLDLSWKLDGLRTTAKCLRSKSEPPLWIVDMAVPANPLLRRLGVKIFSPMNLRANLLRYETTPRAEGKSVFIPMNWAPVAFGCPHISPDSMGTFVLDPQMANNR